MGRIPLGRVAGTALAAGTALGAAMLAAEAWLAAHREYLPATSAPALDQEYGTEGGRVRLAMLGDALAAGVGVNDPSDTVGGHLARRLAALGMRVSLSGTAIAGSDTGDLGPQVSRAMLGRRPDVAVIVVGVEDALHGRPLSWVRRNLREAVDRLSEADVRVIVGTCPDLSAVRAFPQPLRMLLGWRGRSVATAQTEAALVGGGVPVNLAACTGAVFRADPGTFSSDLFHPSADGYRLLAEALLPAVCEAAGSPSPR